MNSQTWLATRRPPGTRMACALAAAAGAFLLPGAAGATQEDGAPARAAIPAHLSQAQRIERDVQRLARALSLDAGQQQRLRAVLEEEHRQLRALRDAPSDSGAEGVVRIKAILDRTRGQIRELLTDAQRARYPGVVPSDLLGPAHADPDRWRPVKDDAPAASATSGRP